MNPRASAEFWRNLLGLKYRNGHEAPPTGASDPHGNDWLNLLWPDDTPCLAFQKVDDLPRSTWPSSEIPQQVHLDLGVPDTATFEEMNERVLAFGGTLLYDRSSDADEPLRVYADLDGHPFCIFISP